MEIDRLSTLSDLIYVHVDLDVLDPEDMPGAGLPVEDGPTADELAEALEISLASYPAARDPDRRGLESAYRLVEGVVKGVKNRG